MKQIFLILVLCPAMLFADAQQKAVPVLNHFAIYVKNLDSSVAFYTRLFQIDSIQQPFGNDARVKWFIIKPGIQFHMVEGANKKVDIPVLTHICFSVPSLTGFIALLKQNGIAYYDSFRVKDVIQHRPDGINQIFFQDPDGYWLEVNDAAR
ncbi:VOC family protein [Parafilimonas sp.]|uniref:VOC family protein n=1 Tax=Parafilimonas sp. TaxID=1969739 RepID=UPI0039E63E9C